MRVSIVIKHLASLFLLNTGIIGNIFRKKAAARQHQILMYHRIIDPSKENIFVEPGMYVTPATFALHLKALREWFVPVSLADLLAGGHHGDKPRCSLTFDDGWIDFFTNAYPLLKKYEIPATVYLVTSYIGTGKRFWTDELADALFSEPPGSPNAVLHSRHADTVSILRGFKGNRHEKMDRAVTFLKAGNPAEIPEIINELRGENSAPSRKSAPSFVNWEQIREMSASGLITFGSHTDTHPILTKISDNEVRNELSESAQILCAADVVKKASLSFCYPNGDHSPEIIDCVKASGYNNAVTTRQGWVSPESDRFALPRTGIHEDIGSTTPLFLGRLSKLF